MRKDRNVPTWLLAAPIAHRGLYNNPTVPENSLSAFSAATCAGVPIELDVHLLADQRPVVFHDQNLWRMTGAEGKIEAQDSQTIRKLHLLKTEQTIPLLAHALQIINGAVPVLIEIKSARLRVGELESAVLRDLQTYRGAVAVQSFNGLSMNYFRKQAPSVCRGQLSTGYLGVPLAWLHQPDFIAYNVNFLTYRVAARLRRSGAALLAWTVKNEAQCAKAKVFADNYIFEATPDFIPLSSNSKNSNGLTISEGVCFPKMSEFVWPPR